MAYGTTSKGSDGLPMGSVQVPGQTNLTPLMGGTITTDANSNTAAPGVVQQDDGRKTTYSFSATALAGVAGDVLLFKGSSTKTVRVTQVIISGTATTAINLYVQLIKRSAADTAGTTGTAPTIAPHASANAAATATVAIYTAAPTAGTSVGIVRAARLFLATPTTSPTLAELIMWDFGVRPGARGVAECLAVNLSAAPTAGSIDISFEFTEE